MKYYIYCITNKLNNKSYVGQSIEVKRRWNKHINGSNKVKDPSNKGLPIQNAIKKYGKENFYWQIIEELDTLDECNDAEEFFIAYFQTLAPNGYNLKPGGKNHRPVESVRKRISETLKITGSFVGKKGPLHPNYGTHLSEERKKLQSETLSGDNGPNKKINSEIAREIYNKFLNDGNLTALTLSKEYNLGHNTILNIIHKKSWKKALADLPDIKLIPGKRTH